MPRPPEVTVVIPTKDRWPLLSASLAAALQQERVELEVIVVDDGSSDETPSRLAEISDPRVRVRRHEQSRGVSCARNSGVAAARGKWVAFLDDDDLWSPSKLRVQLEAAGAPEVGFVYCGAVVLDEERNEIRPDEPVPDPDSLAGRLMNGNAIPGGCSSVMARTDVVRHVGSFDPRLSMLADWDLWLRLSDAGRGAACDEVLVAYRRHARNMTLTDLEHVREEVEYFAAKQRAERGMAFDRIQYSRWLAGEAPTAVAAARVYFRTGIAYRRPGNVALAAATLLGARSAVRATRRVRHALRARALESSTAAAPPWLAPYR